MNAKHKKTIFIIGTGIFRVLTLVFLIGVILLLGNSVHSALAKNNTEPDGFHDGNQGTVDSIGCIASGWAVDPDDPNRDLRVQILADGKKVTTTTADLEREDLYLECPGGTCGFWVSLWGLISPGVEHEITAQAWDKEISQWINLEATPKSLTCWGYPEGFHDGSEGTVDINSCNAFGWAADPDDPNRDLQVQILYGDGIITTTANLLREDVTECKGGTCGFNVNLWDLIATDVPHEITAQAYDVESDLWVDLEATPKTLTCLTLVTYIVNTTDDDNDGVCDEDHCSLREALNTANSILSASLIKFNISGEPPYIIQPQSALPDITAPVIIDGTTQPGYNGTPVIELVGTAAGTDTNGLSIDAGDSTVKSLLIDRFSGSGIAIRGSADNIIEGNVLSGNEGSGILIEGENAAGNVVRGNLIGLNPEGTSAWPNYDGIWLGVDTHDNIIGGTTAEERNIISGNTIYGISVNYGAKQNHFIGNYLGTDLTGTQPLGNGGGILLGSGSYNNMIGSTQAGAGNLISGNWGDAVVIGDSGSTGNIVQGNYIGTDVTGRTATGLDARDYHLKVVFACPTYEAGTKFDVFESESAEPLAPWSGTSVHFYGTDECNSEMLGEAKLIYRYKLEFDEDTRLTSVAVSGAAFNGPDSILRVLDENKNVVGITETFGGNSFQTQYLILEGVEGEVFYIEEFDTSSTWRFRQSIVINGPAPMGNHGNGVTISNGASGNLIGGTDPAARNIISGNFSSGVTIVSQDTFDNTVQGNFIGTDANGTTALANFGPGVWIGDGACNNIIGRANPGAGNVISGNNGDGISINDAKTSGIEVQGNYIGTNAYGNEAIGNLSNGVILVNGTHNNLIAENLISANGGDGIIIANPGTNDNSVQGNLIGTDASGNSALPNGGVGVWIGEGAVDTLVGGVVAGQGNLISGNTYGGVGINHPQTTGTRVLGNTIGTNLDGDNALPNGGDGVYISASQSTIGGAEPEARNLISGNAANGVAIREEGTGNVVQGNYIGTDATGSTVIGQPGPDVGNYKLKVVFACPTYAAETDFDGFVSQSDDAKGPWSGSSVHFKGTDDCKSPESLGEAEMIYRYKLVFDEVTQLTSMAVSGAAFNGPDNVLRVLDENMNVVGMTDTYGGNSFQTQYITMQAVEGKVFYIDEFDTSSTWRFRQSIVINGPVSLGNRGSGVIIANGASENLIGGTDEGAGNLISGNRYDAVGIADPGTNRNRLEGNFIGTDASGSYALPNHSVGVWIGVGASNNIIGGIDSGAGNVISSNEGDGISINDAETSGNEIRGNFIGTNALGKGALGNLYNGVVLVNGTNHNLIAENLISANGGDGVAIYDTGTSNNTVQSNHIGTDVTGMFALGNAYRGVVVASGASGNFIRGNLISANGAAGIRLSDDGTEGNNVQGNLIGTDITANGPLGNGYIGIRITDGAANNMIGGIDLGAGNTIAFNADAGITLNPTSGPGNSLLANSIFSNGSLGIDLNEDGVTINDPGDSDSGPNGLQNFPVLSSYEDLTISGSLDSLPEAQYHIEFFGVTTCDESGYGEGDQYLGYIDVYTDYLGSAVFSFTLPEIFSSSACVTATATDSYGNTSEFSMCIHQAQ
jgi:CSLREA domain-containing protein